MTLPRRRFMGAFVALLISVAFAGSPAADDTHARARRIISLNPSLTEIVLALGAREALVGIDDFSAELEPSLDALPRVGGLFNPSLEAVVALRPDLVIVVPSVEQRDFRERLGALGIRVEEFANHRFDEVLENITRLGAILGRAEVAQQRVTAISQSRAAIAAAATGLTRQRGGAPRAVVVLQRDPLFVVGANNFIDTLVRDAGAENVAAEFPDSYPRVAMEWLIAAGPDVLIDLSPGAESSLERHWSRWPGLPAVAAGRLIALEPKSISMPGPYLDRTLELLARALWGGDFDARFAEERARIAKLQHAPRMGESSMIEPSEAGDLR